ncbi:MAG: putative metal-binding motif-containing protein [Nanoarchaeota archaeon]
MKKRAVYMLMVIVSICLVSAADNDGDGYTWPQEYQKGCDCDDNNPSIKDYQNQQIYFDEDGDGHYSVTSLGYLASCERAKKCNEKGLPKTNKGDDGCDNDPQHYGEACDKTVTTTTTPTTPTTPITPSCTPKTWYIDKDGDGYYPDGGKVSQCSTPGVGWSNTVKNSGDCDDIDSSVNPVALDIPNNGIDEDCSGDDRVIDYCDNIFGAPISEESCEMLRQLQSMDPTDISDWMRSNPSLEYIASLLNDKKFESTDEKISYLKEMFALLEKYFAIDIKPKYDFDLEPSIESYAALSEEKLQTLRGIYDYIHERDCIISAFDNIKIVLSKFATGGAELFKPYIELPEGKQIDNVIKELTAYKDREISTVTDILHHELAHAYEQKLISEYELELIKQKNPNLYNEIDDYIKNWENYNVIKNRLFNTINPLELQNRNTYEKEQEEYFKQKFEQEGITLIRDEFEQIVTDSFTEFSKDQEIKRIFEETKTDLEIDNVHPLFENLMELKKLGYDVQSDIDLIISAADKAGLPSVYSFYSKEDMEDRAQESFTPHTTSPLWIFMNSYPEFSATYLEESPALRAEKAKGDSFRARQYQKTEQLMYEAGFTTSEEYKQVIGQPPPQARWIYKMPAYGTFK